MQQTTVGNGRTVKSNEVIIRLIIAQPQCNCFYRNVGIHSFVVWRPKTHVATLHIFIPMTTSLTMNDYFIVRNFFFETLNSTDLMLCALFTQSCHQTKVLPVHLLAITSDMCNILPKKSFTTRSTCSKCF